MKHWLLLLACTLCCGLSAAVSLKVEAEKSVLPADREQEALVRISVSADALPRNIKATPRVNLSVALDCSSSMHGGNKIGHALQAAKNAVDLLSDGDMFSLVTYSSSARVLIPTTQITSAAKNEIRQAIDSIRAGGTTALFAGVSLSAEELRKNTGKPGWVNRLILLSDGQANVGPSSAVELGRLGASLIKESISVSTVGIGADYNEDLMTALAQNSDGNFYFVENSTRLTLILEKELGSALSVAAQDIKVRITCPSGIKPRGILGHQCKINNQTIEINFNQLYAGHDRVLILQLDVPPQADGKSAPLADIKIEYKTADSERINAVNRAVAVAFSSDSGQQTASLNKDVSASVVLQKSAVMRQEALQAADAGNYQAGAQKLKEANQMLQDNAAVTGNDEVIRNASLLEQDQSKLEQAKEQPSSYNTTRKAILGRGYQLKNSQQYKQ
jgi:Ca-activated chloride channel family protein